MKKPLAEMNVPEDGALTTHNPRYMRWLGATHRAARGSQRAPVTNEWPRAHGSARSSPIKALSWDAGDGTSCC